MVLAVVLHCEALAGVADPETTDTQRGECLYPGGRVVLASRNSQHAAELGYALSLSILQIVTFQEDRLIIKP